MRFRPASGLLALALLVLTAPSVRGGSHDSPDPDRYIVIFKDAARGAAALRSAGIQTLVNLPQVNAVAALIPPSALDGLRRNPSITLIEPDSPRYPLAQSTPYGVRMVEAAQLPEGAGNRTVCIIDSGYSSNHEDLKTSGVTGYTGGNLDPFEDGCGHGTHVAGTIAAVSNSVGVVGVTPGVNLHIVRVFDNRCRWAYASDLIDAAYRCQAAGANVISMSLGCSSSPFCASSAENAAFEDLYSAGILSVAAAGNDGNRRYSYPASYASVVSVAAIDSAKNPAGFSQRNDQVELAAPGVTVRSTVPMGTGTDESVSVDGIGYEVTGMSGSPSVIRTGPLVDCGLGTSACPGGGGQVCLIQRGSITFAEKAQACEAGDGVAAIVYNDVAGLFSGTLGSTVIGIPVVGMSDTDGLALSVQGGTATVETGPGNYAFWDGTSMATPHVAGVAALVWSHNPGWTNRQIRGALDATAEDLGAAGKDNSFGWGLVQAAAALAYLQGGGSPSQTPTATPTPTDTPGGGGAATSTPTATQNSGGPVCAPVGAACSSDSDCCSSKCRGGGRSGSTCR